MVKIITPIGLSFLLMLGLGGCASKKDLKAVYGPLSCPVEQTTHLATVEAKASTQSVFRFQQQQLNWRQSVYFASGQSKVKASDVQQVNANIRILKANPSFNLLLKGFTDSSGSTALNQRLSLNRVLSVGQLLVDQGISKERIFIAAEGEMALLNADASLLDKAVNRRVDMILLGISGVDGLSTLSDQIAKPIGIR